MSDLAIIALTPRGLELGRRIAQALGRGEVLPTEGSAADTLMQAFHAHRPLVCIMALGIVVRILGSLAKDKNTDPPVVVVDETGRFAISVLSGHVGGANELAQDVAIVIGAIPVITTASDGLGLPAIDLIGRQWGWKIENPEQLTAVISAMVRGEPIAVYQDAGYRHWWAEFGGWPSTFKHTEKLPNNDCAAMLIISDRCLPNPTCPYVKFRPPTLVLGVGCKRGVPFAEIEAMFQEVCQREQLCQLSLGKVATAVLKGDEPGLLQFASRHAVPLHTYSLEELNMVTELPTPSERVRSKIGIPGVAEPAAMLAAGTARLIMPKRRTDRITMALARREDA